MAALIPPVHLKGIRTHGNTDPKGSPNRRIAPKQRARMRFLADAFSLIVDPCYALTHNWWLAILLFTVIIKIVLMPMALWVQKNSIVMVQLMPALNRIKIRYFGDAETIGEKQTALYKEKRYHPMLSLIPLAIQVIILFGLVDVVHGITDSGTPGTEFLGLIPVEDGGLSWIMPVLAGLSAVAMGCTQNLINPLQKEQTRLEKNTTNGLSIALSFFLGMFVAAGMAFYWICSNLLSILVQIACNIIIKPAKYIDYDELNARYYGPAVEKDDTIKYEWARIPHFYNAFYVYKYATGYSAATAISEKILNEGRPAADRYIEFLKTGESDYPIELLKIAGVDMSTPEPVEKAMDTFNSLLDEFEKLI